MDTNIGIYKIVCNQNNNIYIGQSKHIQQRWNTHKQELRNNKHHNDLLQEDFNNFGELSFEFGIIHLGDLETLDMLERFYIDKYKDRSYNIKCGNKNKCTLNRELSTEEFMLLKKFKDLSRLNMENVRSYMNLMDDMQYKYDLVNRNILRIELADFKEINRNMNGKIFTDSFESYLMKEKGEPNIEDILYAKVRSVFVLASTVVFNNIKRAELKEYIDVVNMGINYDKSKFTEGRLVLNCTVIKTEENFEKVLYF